MKNRNIIILMISVAIVLIIMGIVCLNKNVKLYHNDEELNVKLYYSNLEFDIETGSYRYNETELTNKQQKKIIEFYKKTNTKAKEYVDLAFIGMIKLEFSDGNVIFMDDNEDSYGYNGEYCIKLSNGFKKYILSIIN